MVAVGGGGGGGSVGASGVLVGGTNVRVGVIGVWVRVGVEVAVFVEVGFGV